MLLTILRDIVKHTASLGAVETLKITGTATETLIESVNVGQNLILKARLNEPSADLTGVFGLMNLPVLAGYAEFPSFRTDTARITLERRTRNGEEVPVRILFADDQGQSFSYRLMSKEVVQAQPELPNLTWDISFQPQKTKLEEFRRLASILGSIHKDFIPRTVDGDLRFYVGGENTATHDGFLIFERGIQGRLSGNFAWAASAFLNLMRLAETEETTVRMSEQGLLALTVTSEVAEYTYILGGRSAA